MFATPGEAVNVVSSLNKLYKFACVVPKDMVLEPFWFKIAKVSILGVRPKLG